MYPESFLWWLGGIAVLIGFLGLMGLLALWVDNTFQRRIEKEHDAPGDNEEE